MAQINALELDRFQLGDHLAVSRSRYDHHGIYVGQGMVIHFDSQIKSKLSAVIRQTSLKGFAKGAQIKVIGHPHRAINRVESVRRARNQIGQGNYSLIFFNCEHFVNMCIEDERRSEQVEKPLRLLRNILFS